MGIVELKIISAGLILVMTLVAAYLPFKVAARDRFSYQFSIGNALASGIFLGTALLHMLAEANHEVAQTGIQYPIVYFIAGSTFLLLLLLEHVGMELMHHRKNAQNSISVLAVLMLSIHSLFEGVALGGGESMTTLFVILTAILAHKWAAAFALAIELNRSELGRKKSALFFAIFALATPIGIGLGDTVTEFFPSHTLAIATLDAMAAGTFLYIGTLHGLQRSVMVKQCCDLRTFAWVIVGFLLMAVVPFIF